MKRIDLRVSLPRFFRILCDSLPSLLPVLRLAARSQPQPKATPSQPSDIKVEVHDGGPIVMTTSAAEFQILPSGFLQASLLKDGKRLTLDEPDVGSAGGSDSIVQKGKNWISCRTFRRQKFSRATGNSGAGSG